MPIMVGRGGFHSGMVHNHLKNCEGIKMTAILQLVTFELFWTQLLPVLIVSLTYFLQFVMEMREINNLKISRNQGR